MSKTALVLAISTAQAFFALKLRRINTHATIPRECLLGECVLCTQAENLTALRQCQSPSPSFRAKRGNPLNRNVHLCDDCQKPHLFSQSLPRREFALSNLARAKILPQFRASACLVSACQLHLWCNFTVRKHNFTRAKRIFHRCESNDIVAP